MSWNELVHMYCITKLLIQLSNTVKSPIKTKDLLEMQVKNTVSKTSMFDGAKL